MLIIKSEYIRRKLSHIKSIVEDDTKQKLYDINKTAEDIFMHILNNVYGWQLVNANDIKPNFPAIDLIDTTNEIVIQVTSSIDDSKVTSTIEKFEKFADDNYKNGEYKIYSDYQIKMFYIKDKPKKFTKATKTKIANQNMSDNDFLGIEDINKKVSANPTIATKVFKTLCKILHDKVCDSDTPPNLTTKSSTHDSSFIGREDEVKAIDEILESSNSLLLINGIGGIGKSSLANHYLYIREKEFDYYGFIDGLDSFISEFRNSLDLKAQKEDELYVEIIYKLRNLQGKKLLVIDNVEDIESHKNLIEMLLSLHKYNYKVLFTSRRKIKKVKAYYLGTLPLNDARELFLSYFKTDDLEKVETIIEYLGLHALFIKLVAETIKNEGYTLDDIIEKFEDKNGGLSKIDYIDEESGDEVTFNQNLQELFSMQNLKDEYVLLLKRLSVLPSIDIKLSFLEEILGKERLKGRLNFLVGRGWLIENEGSYKLHQIIKEFILANYAPCFEEIEEVFDYLNILISESSNPQTVVAVKDKLVYFKSSINIIEYLQIKNKKIGDFYTNVGNIYLHLADYEKALDLIEKSLKIRKYFLKDDDINIAISYNNLGEYYRIIGRREDAIVAYLEAIKIGKNDDLNCITYDNLAGIYLSLGDEKNCILFMDKSLSSKIKILGEDSLLVIVQYTNFAGFYLNKNEYDNALKYFNIALNIAKKILDANHLDKANIYMGLSVLYFNIQNYETAYIYVNLTLKIREKNLPSEHPELLEAKRHLDVVKKKLNIVDRDK